MIVCLYLVPFLLSYSTSNNGVPLGSGMWSFKVTENTGVLSLVLFSIFIDDLVKLVSKTDTIGCRTGACCTAIFL